MDTLIPCAGGLDVHKKFIMACVRKTDLQTGQVSEQVKRFGTMTCDLLRMGDWLAAAGVTDVAMESTGVYWKPVWNLLEGRFKLLLANPRELKQVPGRKTDVKDSHNSKQWPFDHRLMLPLARNLRGSGPLASAIDRQNPTTRHEKRVTARWALGMRRRFHASQGSEGREGRVASRKRWW